MKHLIYKVWETPLFPALLYVHFAKRFNTPTPTYIYIYIYTCVTEIDIYDISELYTRLYTYHQHIISPPQPPRTTFPLCSDHQVTRRSNSSLAATILLRASCRAAAARLSDSGAFGFTGTSAGNSLLLLWASRRCNEAWIYGSKLGTGNWSPT